MSTKIVEVTGYFWWTEEQAIEESKKRNNALEEGSPRYYWSYIKGTPDNPERPEECYAITNRYDPKVVAFGTSYAWRTNV